MSATVYCGICADDELDLSYWDSIYCHEFQWELCIPHHKEYQKQNPHLGCTDREGKEV